MQSSYSASAQNCCILTMERNAKRSLSLDGDINDTGDKKKSFKNYLFNLLFGVSKFEQLTRTCHGKRQHITGQNTTERLRKAVTYCCICSVVIHVHLHTIFCVQNGLISKKKFSFYLACQFSLVCSVLVTFLLESKVTYFQMTSTMENDFVA